MPEQDQSLPTIQSEPAPAAPARVASRSSFGIPLAIVFSALLIAGAIVYTSSQKSPGPTALNTGTPTQETPEVEVAPLTADDHILGNPNAPVVIVEYSDFDCPFCKNFHDTMKKVMAEYGADGKVAWVYRHFPLEQLHPNAPLIAAASECVAELGGNDAFWKFSDLIFGERATNAQTDILKLPEYAEKSGVSRAKFNQCTESGKYTDQITADIDAAVKTGARGTPYSIMMAGGQLGSINGAQPYATVKQMIDTVLAQAGTATDE